MSLRYCPSCKTDKSLIEFLSKTGRTTYGYCRDCMKAYRAGWSFAKHGAPETRFCDLCGTEATEKRKLAFDHNHETGEFRGWLCMSCNVLLGHANDDIELLNKAIQYLEERGGKCTSVNADEVNSTASTADTPDSPDKPNSHDKSTG
jgi:hypothetical protein